MPAATERKVESVGNDVAAEAGRVAVASSVATALTKSLLHPLDTMKCRVQIHSTSLATSQHKAPHRHLAVWQAVRHQYAGKWGPRYLYGGLPVKLVMYVPYQATYMTTYNATRSLLAGQYERASPAMTATPLTLLPCTIAAAVMAELCSCVVRVPMETMKMRIQSTVAGTTQEAVRQMRRNGLRACARLVVPQTLMHDIPYSILQWASYEGLRPCWPAGEQQRHQRDGATDSGSRRQDTSRVGLYQDELVRTFFSGGFSGLVAATLTLPLDNIRTRVVVATALHPQLGVRDVMGAAYRADGLLGFVRGGSMRVLWVTTNMALYFPSFELCRTLLKGGEGGWTC